MSGGTSLLEQIGTFASRHNVTLPVISPVATNLMVAVQRDDVTPADVVVMTPDIDRYASERRPSGLRAIALATETKAVWAGFAPSRQLSGRSGHNIQV